MNLVTQEAEIGGSRLEASPGKSLRCYLKSKTQSRSMGVWFLAVQQSKVSEFNPQYRKTKAKQMLEGKRTLICCWECKLVIPATTYRSQYGFLKKLKIEVPAIAIPFLGIYLKE
jgi:hypothetical protein